MATLAERVLALTEQGYNFPTIAAILNVTPAQVEEVWEDASTELPGGGEGEPGPQGEPGEPGPRGPEGPSAYKSAVLASSPDSYWRMSAATGSEPDIEGLTPGVYAGAVLRGVTGILGVGADSGVGFEAGGGMVAKRGERPALDGEWTVELWLKREEANTIPFSTRGPQDLSFDLQLNANGAIHCDIGDGTKWLTTEANAGAGSVPNDGDWHHVVAVVKEGAWALFVDGEEAAGGELPGGVPLLWDTEHDLVVNHGVGFGASQPQHVDEVAVYDSALSTEAVEAHYAARSAVAEKGEKGEQGPPGPAYSPYASTILTAPGLLSYWRLNETSGTTAADSSGEVPGTYGADTEGEPEGGAGAYELDAGPLVARDTTASSVHFNGTGGTLFNPKRAGHVILPNHAGLEPSPEATWEAWVILHKYGAVPANDGEWIIIANGDESSGKYGFALEAWARTEEEEGAHLALYALSGNLGEVHSEDTFSFDAIHHLVGTFDKGVAKLYVDGVKQTILKGGSPGGGSAEDFGETIEYGIHTTGPAAIGCASEGFSASRGWGGRLAEVAVYNRALPEAEVIDHYELGAGV